MPLTPIIKAIGFILYLASGYHEGYQLWHVAYCRDYSLWHGAYYKDYTLWNTDILEAYYLRGPKTPQIVSKNSKTLADEPFNIPNHIPTHKSMFLKHEGQKNSKSWGVKVAM